MRLATGRDTTVLPAEDVASASAPHRLRTVGEGAPRAASLCVVSGKGGTGKSVVTASLATRFAARGRTLIVDADFGVGNAHILQDVSPTRSLVDVVQERAHVRDVLLPCSGQIDLLAAGSGVPRMAELSKYETHRIAAGIEELELEYRFLLVDSAAGIGRQTVGVARASDAVLVVTTPDLTAMTDAYALLKVLRGRRPTCRPLLVVNRARDEAQAESVAKRIQNVSRRFLGGETGWPRFIGWLPEDPAVRECVNRRAAVVLLEPEAPFSIALETVAVRLLEELASLHPKGLGRTLVELTGYPAQLG